MMIDSGRRNISSLSAKKLDNKEFVDKYAEQGFNSLKGNFFNNEGFHTNNEKKSSVEILENGSYFIKVEIDPFVTQTIAMTAGEPRIDFRLKIHWEENTGIENLRRKITKRVILERRFKMINTNC